MMKTKALALLLCIIGQSFAFLTLNAAATVVAARSSTMILARRDGLDDYSSNYNHRPFDESVLAKNIVSGQKGFWATSVLAGLATGLCSFVSRGMASDEYEMAELPPPYVPAIFAVVLLAGIGVLTGSLGDVMDEGRLHSAVLHWDIFRILNLIRFRLCFACDSCRGITRFAIWSTGKERD
jgi:hypothetical protein